MQVSPRAGRTIEFAKRGDGTALTGPSRTPTRTASTKTQAPALREEGTTEMLDDPGEPDPEPCLR